MRETVLFADAEQADERDFDAIGALGRISLDAIVGEAIGYPNHWAGFTVAIASAQEITIAPGSYYEASEVFGLDESLTRNLQTYFPFTPGDEKFVAILARGNTETLQEERSFDTSNDPETQQIVQITTPKRSKRVVEFTVQQGISAPPPALRPDVADTNCAICFVRLTTAGVQEVLPTNDSRVKSLYEVDGRLTALELRVSDLFQRIEDIETVVANLAGQITDIPRPDIIRQMQRDNAQTRRVLLLPDEARAYWYDAGLLYDEWDVDHAEWSARVFEGIYPAYQSQRDDQMALNNVANPDVRTRQTVLMPDHEDVIRLEVDGSNGAKDISQKKHTEITSVKRTVTRYRTAYGPSRLVCENAAEWASAQGRQAGATFNKGGETFQVQNIANRDHGVGHYHLRVRSLQTYSYQQTYWDEIVETFGINGSVYGQTWLNSQPMVMTSLALKFTRVGTATFTCACANAPGAVSRTSTA